MIQCDICGQERSRGRRGDKTYRFSRAGKYVPAAFIHVCEDCGDHIVVEIFDRGRRQRKRALGRADDVNSERQTD